jgi:hypothetical protein
MRVQVAKPSSAVTAAAPARSNPKPASEAPVGAHDRETRSADPRAVRAQAAPGAPPPPPVQGPPGGGAGSSAGRAAGHARAPAPSAVLAPVSESEREQQADRAAEDVLAGNQARIHARSPVARWRSDVPVAADRRADLERAFAAGEPLPGEVRRRFERGFGTDLGIVRIHADPGAARAAEAVRAVAFTSGPHIVFGAGAYAPSTTQGSRLLAHELAHVVQQGMTGVPRLDRHSSADHRLPANLAEALALATSANTAITGALAALGSASDPRQSNIPALIAQLGATLGPLTPRHDSPPGAATINFFTGTTNYADSAVLPATATHRFDAAGTKIWIRARGHIDVDSIWARSQIQRRIVRAVTELGDLRSGRSTLAAATTFDLYRSQFNALYFESPHNGLSNNYVATLDSRGPKSARARSVFNAVLAQSPTLAADYNNNVGGIREQVDRYYGPEGLNRLNSAGLQRLSAVFTALVPPVAAAAFAGVRASINTTAQSLTPEDRAEVERSNEWQIRLTRYFPAVAQRDDIRNVIRTATPPVAAVAPVAPVAPVVPGGTVTPQQFVDSVALVAPVAAVPAIDRTVPVTLQPRSGLRNPGVAISSQTTVTPAGSVVGGAVSPASRWPAAANAGVPFTPTISVTGAITLRGQLALVNGPSGLARSSPIPPVSFSVADQRMTNIATGWQPRVLFNDLARSVPFVPGTSHPRYFGGGQTIAVRATMPVPPSLNPGLTLSVEAEIRRGGVIIPGTVATRAVFPVGAVESNLVTFSISSPGIVGTDPVSIFARLVNPGGVLVAPRTVAIGIGPEATYTQAAAETRWNEDEAHLHDAVGGFLHHLSLGTGAAPGLAGLIRTPANPLRPIQIHPMVQRHDSAAYVNLALGGAHPEKAAYVIATPPYGAHPDPKTIVEPTGAGGWRITGAHPAYVPPFILLSRTPDVTLAVPRRPDSELQIYAIHESTHIMDRPAGGTPIQKYKTEFRAYWMDGRYGPPTQATAGLSAVYDPNIPQPGPKSRRANEIFRLQYDDPILYSYCKPNYDANTANFRDEVDSYLVPDGINLTLSSRVEDLRVIFAAGIVGGFPAFQTSVRAFVGIAGVGGSMNAAEKAAITRSRAWRDLVDGLPGATAPQKAALKVDMRIP